MNKYVITCFFDDGEDLTYPILHIGSKRDVEDQLKEALNEGKEKIWNIWLRGSEDRYLVETLDEWFDSNCKNK